MILLKNKILKIGLLMGTGLPFMTATSCGNVDQKVVPSPTPKPQEKTYIQEYLNLPASAFYNQDGIKVLNGNFYNSLLDKGKHYFQDNYLIFAIIANNSVYAEIINYQPHEKAIDAAKRMSHIAFKYHNVGLALGAWIQTFKIKTEKGWSGWQHGEAQSKNYGDFYPLYDVNHVYASLGISNFRTEAQDIYEVSYDHNS